MGNEHDRIAKLGIIGLAGIAILGWVRQPEKHTEIQPAERAVFQLPQRNPEPGNIPESPKPQAAEEAPDPVEQPTVRRPKRFKRSSVHRQSTLAEPAQREQVLEVARPEGRHELPSLESQPEQTRTRETQPAPPSPVHPLEPARNPAADPVPHTTARDPKRTTSRSIAIIAGAAAAGAAIGGIAGHGKGAAIGAAAGAASGYMYDRMSRRNSRTPSNTSGAQDNAQVHRFGTPYFN